MKKKVILSVFSLAFVAVLLPTITFAWFTGKVTVSDNVDRELSSNASYYGGGDGSINNPYKISAARHLYNLAWLQDLGYYDGDNKKYFRLDDDVDMTSIGAIPPIGIDAHPFVSSFEGNGHIIKNAVIETNGDNFDVRPSNVILSNHTEDTLTSINGGEILTSNIGLFGEIKSTDDPSTADINEGVNNFILDNCKVKYRRKDAKIGIVAGYVNGNLTKVGVSKSSIDIQKDVQISNDKNEISKYSLVGSMNDNDAESGGVEWVDKPGGQGIGFGGSISIMTACRRLNYIQSSLGHRVTTGGGAWISGSYNTDKKPTNDFNIVFRSSNINGSSNCAFDWEDKTLVRYGDMLQATYLPINTDLETMGIDPDKEVVETTNENGKINDYYANNTKEIVAKSNTGYFVGYSANYDSSAQGLRFRMQSTSNSDAVHKSMGYTTSGSNVTFDNDRLQLIASEYNSNQSFRTIKDSHNSSWLTDETRTTDYQVATPSDLHLEKYDTVRENLTQMFQNNMLYGVRFTYTICPTETVDLSQTQINARRITVSPSDGIVIAGKTYNNYEFLTGGFNFTVANKGYITYVLGTYGNSGTSYKPVSIFSVDRDSNQHITAVKKITSIRKINNQYVYNSSSSEGIQVYDGSAKDLPGTNMLYYFEVPVNPGDYFLSAGVSNASNYLPYFMYLDIGANGESSGSSSLNSKISEVDFVNLETGSPVPFSADYGSSNVLFSITIQSSSTSEIVLYFERKDLNAIDNIQVYYNQDDNTVLSAIGKISNAILRT